MTMNEEWKQWVSVSIVILCVLVLGFFRHKHDSKVDKATASQVLPPNAVEKLIVNSRSHTIKVVTSKGTETKYTGDSPASIVVNKNGSAEVTTRSFGTETEPFIGLSYGDKMRLVFGASLFYYHNWDLNVALTPSVSGDFTIRGLASVSYNVYDNTSLFVGLDSSRSPVGGLMLRF